MNALQSKTRVASRASQPQRSARQQKVLSRQQKQINRFVVRAEEEGGAEVAPAEEAEPAPAPVVKAGETGLTGEAFGLNKQDVPGIFGIGANTAALTYINPALPGNYGFDPLGLSDPEGAGGALDPEWLGYAELIHGRWAMLGVVGAVTPEILGDWGIIPPETAMKWWETGVIPPASAPQVDGMYWADPFSIFFVEVVLMQFAELRRLQDYRKPGSMGKQYFLGFESILGGSGEPGYPGGRFFNLLNFGKDSESLAELKLKEIKNGRLAMMAMLGVGAQAVMTHQGPYENLKAHLLDPVANNVLTNFGSVQGIL